MPAPRDPRLIEGLRLLRAREWFEAHEEIEDAWRDTPPGELRECLQGVIQFCVALEHLRRGNALGCNNVAARGRQRLEALPPVVHGMHTHDWSAALTEFFDRIGLPALVERYRASGGFSDTTPPPTPPMTEWPMLRLDPELELHLAD